MNWHNYMLFCRQGDLNIIVPSQELIRLRSYSYTFSTIYIAYSEGMAFTQPRSSTWNSIKYFWRDGMITGDPEILMPLVS